MTKKLKRSKVFCSWCGLGDKAQPAMLKLGKHNLFMCWSCLERAYQAMLIFIWTGKKS